MNRSAQSAIGFGKLLSAACFVSGFSEQWHIAVLHEKIAMDPSSSFSLISTLQVRWVAIAGLSMTVDPNFVCDFTGFSS